MKKLLFVLLILFSVNLFAEKTDAIFLKIDKTYIQHEDGKIEYRHIHDLKLLTFFAIHRKYGESTINYNPHFQEVIIHEVYTLLENGKKVSLPFNAINEILPNEAIDAPTYNHLRRMVITHTGLEINCVIHIDYSIIFR